MFSKPDCPNPTAPQLPIYRNGPSHVDRPVQGQEESAGSFVRAPRVQRDAVPWARDDGWAAGAARGVGPGTCGQKAPWGAHGGAHGTPEIGEIWWKTWWTSMKFMGS